MAPTSQRSSTLAQAALVEGGVEQGGRVGGPQPQEAIGTWIFAWRWERGEVIFVIFVVAHLEGPMPLSPDGRPSQVPPVLMRPRVREGVLDTLPPQVSIAPISHRVSTYGASVDSTKSRRRARMLPRTFAAPRHEILLFVIRASESAVVAGRRISPPPNPVACQLKIPWIPHPTSPHERTAIILARLAPSRE